MRSTEYRALITDLDGTAVAIGSDGRDVDEATKRAVSRAIAAGKQLACATGRPWWSARPVLQALGFVGPCVFEGGARIADRVNAAGGLVDIHVTHPEATKQHGIRVWQKLLGVTKAQTIGMGDSGNDIPIFESAGLKVAVASSTADIKALADHIAPPVD